jgi:hypothetical protein
MATDEQDRPAPQHGPHDDRILTAGGGWPPVTTVWALNPATREDRAERTSAGR